MDDLQDDITNISSGWFIHDNINPDLATLLFTVIFVIQEAQCVREYSDW